MQCKRCCGGPLSAPGGLLTREGKLESRFSRKAASRLLLFCGCARSVWSPRRCRRASPELPGVRSVRPAQGSGPLLFLSTRASQELGASFASFRSLSQSVTRGCFSDGDEVMYGAKCTVPVRALAHSTTTRWRFEEGAGPAVRLPRPDLCLVLPNLPSSGVEAVPSSPWASPTAWTRQCPSSLPFQVLVPRGEGWKYFGDDRSPFDWRCRIVRVFCNPVFSTALGLHGDSRSPLQQLGAGATSRPPVLENERDKDEQAHLPCGCGDRRLSAFPAAWATPPGSGSCPPSHLQPVL